MPRTVIAIAVALAALTGVAAAQPEESPERKACKDELRRLNEETRGAAAKQGKTVQLGPVTRVVELVTAKPACLTELQDPKFSSELDEVMVLRVHEEEAARYRRDQRHVWMAYIAIWLLTAGFVGFMFLRQTRLRAEIERLRGELTRAVKDDP